MTDSQKIERLAEFMGWHKVEARGNGNMGKIWATHNRDQNKHWDYAEDLRWNPLTDWNHWRQVEEKVMEDDRLCSKFVDTVNSMLDDRFTIIITYMHADLPTRVDALLAALYSSSPQTNG